MIIIPCPSNGHRLRYPRPRQRPSPSSPPRTLATPLIQSPCTSNLTARRLKWRKAPIAIDRHVGCDVRPPKLPSRSQPVEPVDDAVRLADLGNTDGLNVPHAIHSAGKGVDMDAAQVTHPDLMLRALPNVLNDDRTRVSARLSQRFSQYLSPCEDPDRPSSSRRSASGTFRYPDAPNLDPSIAS